MKASEFFKKYPLFREPFEELCRRVGTTLDALELKQNEKGQFDWCYDAHSWTPEEEKDFGEWLADYFFKNRRKLNCAYMKKKHIEEHEVPYWLLMYSWRYK